MKRKLMLLLVGLCLLSFGACKEGKGTETSEPSYSPTNELLEESEKIEDKKIQGGLSKPLSENVVSLSQGKVLQQLKVVGEDGPYYCNLEENMTRVFLRTPEEYPVAVCKDPVYDITYYVNYGRDYFIYAKRGGISECVVEIPARDLYCREGILYFRSDTYNLYEFDSFEDGAILAYNPVNGSMEVVVNEPTFEMAVYPDGIFYVVSKPVIEEDGTVSETSTQRYKYFYSFENKESTEFGPSLHTVARWKDYRIVMEFVKEEDMTKTVYHLETPDGVSDGVLPNLTEVLESHRTKKSDLCFLEGYHIIGDSIYYIDKETESLLCYDMVAGAETTVVKLGMPSYYMRNFIIFNDVVYFTNGIRYSLTNKKQYSVNLQGKEAALIQSFYTDGEELFILADGMLWLYEEKKLAEYGYEKMHIQGRSTIMNCYEAVLHPLGE